MFLNPQPDTSIKPQPTTLYNPSIRSRSTERFSYPQLKIDEPQINISRKESCFQGHLFIPQIIHSSIMQTERLRINTNTRPAIPLIGKNRSTLQIGTKHTIENAFKIQKGPLNIKVESDGRMNQYPQHTIDNGRISFRTPIRTAREDSQRAKAFARVYNAPSPLVPRHKRHRSSGISCNNIDDTEHLVYSKGDHITLKDREFFENITKKKSPVNMGPRKLSLNSKPLRTCTRDISPIETKRDTDKWTCTLSTQHSFMRTFTEETTERFRRLTTDTEGGEYSHRRRKSLARTRDFRHTTTGMYGNSDGVVKGKVLAVKENLWVIDGRPTILENMDRLRRAEEFSKESNNLKMEIHNEIDNLTRVIQQKMNIK